MPKPILKQAAIDAVLTALYVALVGIFMHFTPVLFNKPHLPGTQESFLIPIGMIMLFVFSAAICGYLFLGKPLLWYLDGKKKEAVQLFGYSLGFLFIIVVIVFILLGIFQ